MPNFNIGDTVRLPHGKIERVTEVGDGIAYAGGCWANRELQPVPPFRVGDLVITEVIKPCPAKIVEVRHGNKYPYLLESPGGGCSYGWHSESELTPVEESKVEKPAERPVVEVVTETQTVVKEVKTIILRLDDSVAMLMSRALEHTSFDSLKTIADAIKSALAGEVNNVR